MAVKSFEEIGTKKVLGFDEIGHKPVLGFDEIGEPSDEELDYNIPGIADPSAPTLPTGAQGGRFGDLAEKPERIGFFEAAMEHPAEKVPFSPAGAVRTLKTVESAHRLQNFEYALTKEELAKKYPGASAISRQQIGKTTRELYEKDVGIVTKYLEEQAEKARRGYTLGGRVGQILSHMPSFMIEFLATGGLKQVGSKGAKKLGEKVLGKYARTLAGKGLIGTGKFTVGAAARATGMPHRAAEAILKRQLPKGIEVDGDEVKITGPEESKWTSVWKGMVDHYIEIASEEAGEFIAPVAGKLFNRLPLMKKFTGALGRAWLKLHPNRTAAEFAKKISTRAGFHGVIGEIGEEDVGWISRAVLDVEDFGAGPDATIGQRLVAGWKQDIENLPAEAIAFSVPGAARGLAGMGWMAEGPEFDVEPLQRELRGEKRLGYIEREKKQLAEQEQFDTDIEEMDRELTAIQQQASTEGRVESERPTEAITPEEKVETPPAKPAPKQPWEMTRGEHFAEIDEPRWAELRGLKDEYTRSLGAMGAEMASPKAFKRVQAQLDNAIKESDQIAKGQNHKKLIKRAIEQGKPVPAEVLAEYPELAKPAPKPAEGGKQPWEETKEELFDRTSEDIKRAGFTLSVEEVEKNVFYQHKRLIKQAISEGKPVPRHVLEEYKGEKWAQQALAPPAKPVATPEGKVEAYSIKKIPVVAGEKTDYVSKGQKNYWDVFDKNGNWVERLSTKKEAEEYIRQKQPPKAEGKVEAEAKAIRNAVIKTKQPVLDKIALRIANKVKGKYHGSPKSQKSIVNKVARKQAAGINYDVYSPKDHARGSIILNDWSDAPKTIRELQRQGFFIEDTTIKTLNGYGYRGLQATKPLGDGVNGEIQIHTQQSWNLKKVSDATYRRWRDVPDVSKLSPAEKKSWSEDMDRSWDLWEGYWGSIPLAVRDSISSVSKGVASTTAAPGTPSAGPQPVSPKISKPVSASRKKRPSGKREIRGRTIPESVPKERLAVKLPDIKKWDLHDWMAARNAELRPIEKISDAKARYKRAYEVTQKYKNLKKKIPGSENWITSDTYSAQIRTKALKEVIGKEGREAVVKLQEEVIGKKEALSQPVKEITHEETITEPATGLEMEQRETGKPISEIEPTGKLDPVKPEDALKIIEHHAKWLTQGRYKEKRIAVGGIFETKWDKEKGEFVVSSVEYTPEQIDIAYRTVQKPVPSPMLDTDLFAMPGKEAQMQAIAEKMQRVKGVSRKTKKVAKLTKPAGLPKAKTTKADYIKAVYKAANKDETRYAINGLKVEGDTIIATDGRRLFWAKGKWGKDGLYLNAASLKNGLLGKADKKGQAFPKWRDIVPDVSDQKPIVDSLEAVWSNVRRAMTLTTEESKGILVIANKDGSLGFAGASPEVGHVEINVNPGGKILGAVNPQFFLDALSFHATRGNDSFEFYFSDHTRPMLTKSLDGKTFTLTMPINVGDEGPMSEAIAKATAEGKPGEYTPKKQFRAKAGFVDLTPALEIHKTFMRVLEPAKAVERKLGKDAYAAVIKGIHQTDVARVKFEQSELPQQDKLFAEMEEWLDRFPDKDLDNLMLSRGNPISIEGMLVKRDAINKLPKDLRTPKLLKAVQHIADFNYKYLQSVAGDDINRVADYFYGIYKDSKKVDKFLDYWRTTKRFTKEKKLPTYADAKSYGLEIKDPNPIRNLKAEYVAIAHLEGMTWLRDELMRTGKHKYIDDFPDAPIEWDKINDPVFEGLRVQPDLAKLINNLIATNKLTKVPALNTLREVNNVLRTVKFIGSAFHLLSVAKQSIADSGYLGFLYKKTATRGFTTGFRKNDPIFRRPEYKDYIRHGGGHRYSVEAESRKVFNKMVGTLNKEFGKAVKYGTLPMRLPVVFVDWMFNSYIPNVKYAKYLDVVAEKRKKLGRSLTSAEKIDIIKEQQNFYGMMNERLFGRSGTVTTALRFYFLSPGYAEGNYRTIIKAATQWGGKGGFKANRSRSNIINSLILTGALATVGTLIMTGKPPKKPETMEDLRDLFKADTGKKDDKGRRIMIDFMTYDKDYWQAVFNVLKARPDVAVRNAVKRIGGMKAPTADMIVDLALISMGRAVYDWKGDRVTEITDPFLRKVMKLSVHEVRKMTPISVAVYGQARRKEIDRVISAVETLAGYRPTMSEKDKREKQITSRIYSLKGQQEKLYQYLGSIKYPRAAITRYNNTVNDILDSKLVPEKMRKEWRPKLLIDLDRVLANKAYYLTSPRRTPEEIERTRKYLKNFGIGPEGAQKYLNKYWAREKKKVAVSPLETDRVIGRARKRRRLEERLKD